MSWWTADTIGYALNYLISAGLSPYGAAGLVSRWVNVEASGGPGSVNPSSGAFGIGQWLGARKAGIYPNTDFNAQLAYAVSELNGSESRAGNVLRSAQSADQGAVGASMYERAEGYNASSGRDNWTNKTAAGIPAIMAYLSGTSSGPARQDAGTIQLGALAGGGAGALLLISGAIFLYWYLSD